MPSHTTVTLYGIPNCDTVKKSRQWFADRGIAVQFHDFKKQGLDAPTLRQWADALGCDALLNRRGTTWRKLDAAEQAKAGDAEGAQALMLDNLSLIKRPVVAIGQEALTVGFVPSCHIPDDCIDPKRYALFMARSVMADLVASLKSSPGAPPC